MASRAALVACALVGAAGMFADQAGVHDRVRTHIGPPVHAFGGGRSAVVATSAGAIASLALATGNVTWRVVAEEGECGMYRPACGAGQERARAPPGAHR